MFGFTFLAVLIIYFKANPCRKVIEIIKDSDFSSSVMLVLRRLEILRSFDLRL